MRAEHALIEIPRHVGIIMDGNGRWAQARGLPRVAGHREGANAVRRTVESALEIGVPTLTLYAFSADNWKRPADEVSELMRLFGRFLWSESPRCAEQGVRLNVIGRRDRLDRRLVRAIELAERRTAGSRRLHLRLAVDYSARQAIALAARSMPHDETSSSARFDEALNRAIHSRPAAADVDLIIRTSGERRLSDFLLWESAYAELIFLERAWPDFGAADLVAAVQEFGRRERRFGGVIQTCGSGT
jgi:undecaprenyl diphosphate synthase